MPLTVFTIDDKGKEIDSSPLLNLSLQANSILRISLQRLQSECQKNNYQSCAIPGNGKGTSYSKGTYFYLILLETPS